MFEQNLAGLKAIWNDASARFDFITFDPRGVGDSTRIDCGAPVVFETMASLGLDFADDAVWESTTSVNAAITQACMENADPQLISRVDSDSVARDMECIRHALSDPTINYVGFSYGTYLGAKYATLFPHRVRAVVLDSVASLPADMLEVVQDWGVSYDAALERFFAAVGSDPDSPFHGGEGVDAVRSAYDALLLGRRGVTTTATDIGEAGFVAAVMQFLRAGQSTQLATALEQAEGGDFSAVRDAAVLFLGGPEPTDPIFWAISYLDRGCPDIGETELRNEFIALSTQSRGFGAMSSHFTAACLSWNVPVAHPIVPVSAKTAPPFLLVEGTNDPGTPASRSVEMEDALGNGSHVVIYMGEGHGYLPRSECVWKTEEAFVLDPSKPPAVTTCD